jgi:uncharacterized DUF497 family protein
MRLEWDERKNRLNRKKHGIAFSLAARVFADECRILEKDRIDEETGEQRSHAIGRVGGAAIYIVVHVYTGRGNPPVRERQRQDRAALLARSHCRPAGAWKLARGLRRAVRASMRNGSSAGAGQRSADKIDWLEVSATVSLKDREERST